MDLDGVPRGGDVARGGKGRASGGRKGAIEVSRDAVVIVGPGIPPLPDPLWSRLRGGRLDHDCIEGDEGGEDIAKVSNEEVRKLDPSTFITSFGHRGDDSSRCPQVSGAGGADRAAWSGVFVARGWLG
jgi:hypothetical protein